MDNLSINPSSTGELHREIVINRRLRPIRVDAARIRLAARIRFAATFEARKAAAHDGEAIRAERAAEQVLSEACVHRLFEALHAAVTARPRPFALVSAAAERKARERRTEAVLRPSVAWFAEASRRIVVGPAIALGGSPVCL